MKTTLLVISLLYSVFLSGQDTTQVTVQKNKRVYIGANFSPDYCFRTLLNNDGSSFSASIIDSYNKLDKPKFGYTSGVNVGYTLTKHISLEAGIQYSNKGFQTTNLYALTFGDMIDRRRGFVYNTNLSSSFLTSGKIVYRYNYLDVPLKVNFVFGKKKLHLISSVGLTTNFLIRSTTSFVGADSTGKSIKNSSITTNAYNRVNLSPMVSCGIEYMITAKMFFRIEPTFRFGILKLSDTPVTQYLWNAGLNVSYYFKI
jgi:hypothetical protein